jgi:hypothetical protein
MLYDSSKQLSCDLKLLLWKLREELVLLKHVSKHTHKQVLWKRHKQWKHITPILPTLQIDITYTQYFVHYLQYQYYRHYQLEINVTKPS